MNKVLAGFSREDFYLCTCIRAYVSTTSLSATAAALIALELEFDLGCEFESLIFLRIGITGFVFAAQCGREDVFHLGVFHLSYR